MIELIVVLHVATIIYVSTILSQLPDKNLKISVDILHNGIS